MSLNLPPPPPEIPEHFKDKYTNGGMIPVHEMYFDNRVLSPVYNSAALYDTTIAAIKDHTLAYYGKTFSYIVSALADFPISGKSFLVCGLRGCNCDAIGIAYGANKVFVVDYNPPICEHEKIVSMGIEEFKTTGYKPDFAISISSFEHDGLGRYGDPLNPDGDFHAMQELKYHVAPNAILFLAVPIGQDCLVWNAHRIYGCWRLPKLLKDWTFLAAYGLDQKQFNQPLGSYTQPVLVLSASATAINIPKNATPAQRSTIEKLAASGKFNRYSYTCSHPEALTQQMDVISYYILHGDNSNGQNIF